MELKESYKITEVGVIPEDWEVVGLKNISERIMVGIASAATHAYRKSGIPMLRNQNIKKGYLNDSDILHITPEYEEGFINKRLKTGDLLTARTGYPGTTCIVPAKYNDAQSFTTLITRLKSDSVNPLFVCYYINSESGINFFEANKIGGGQKNISVKTLNRFYLPIPPTLKEQTAIATALSDTDDLLQALDRLIAKKRAVKQGAMQQLLTPPQLGGKRLEGFEGDWEVKTLGELGDCIIGLTYSPDDVTDSSGTLVLRSSNIQKGVLSFLDNVYVSKEIPHKITLRKGDILICVRNGSKRLIGKCALITEEIAGNTFGAFMSIYRTPIYSYIFHLFESDIIKRQINECLGATINQITNKNLNSFEVSIPKEKEEQKAIAKVLNSMDKEIQALEAQRAKYQTVKQGMMQELLTGKTRLV
jgi:type I restriction enzyme S subunit